jgi:hypothetical protein
MKTKDKIISILGLAALILFALALNQAGLLGPKLNLGGGQVQPTPTPTTYLSGTFTTDVSAYDALDIATTRGIGTAANVYWYAFRNQWVLLGGGNTDVTVLKDDFNTIYCVVSPISGQEFYVDYRMMQSMNSRIQDVQYKDITGDNVEEYLFKYNIADSSYALGTGKYLIPKLNVYLLTYDDSASLSSPANQTGVGLVKVTKYIPWEVTLSGEKKALAICEVVLEVNVSDTSKTQLKKLNVPGIGNLDGSSFKRDVLSDRIKWTYTVSNVLYGSDYIKLPPNTNNKFDFTMQADIDLAAAGEGIDYTLTIRYFDEVEGLQSLTPDTCSISD